ncbi:restriction endonuclease subunit S [Serratia marcescens]|uniref:restriction endonuclease subunit S n=1 Tax=Serratia marcescens TaxID=615 RepID=UPI001594024B|nr:restriction endonuclease subunit S [Serratia marcescens]NVC31887.1 restriction endonuclease subunit S [Serratia marcescens]NVC45901.1 restriction endonuclease subunit S [Serratia marcescens]QLB27205.1 restriction endonuclease subunit S [Serratia marcescens]
MIFNSSKYNSHWLDKKLSDLGSFRRGKSRHRPRNDPKLFKNGIYPLVQTGEVKQASLYLNSHHSCYNEFGLSQSEIWPKNTLCITIAANIAETALLSYPMCFPDSVVGFNAYQEESSEIFMHYVFTYIRRAIQNSASGSIQDNINIDYLTGLKFKVPLKAYQDKIVSVLSVLDYKIDLNNRINAELEAMAKTLYNYWFVQFDFPDANGKPYKTSGGKMEYNTTLKREIPAGWRASNILSLANLLGGGTPTKTKPEYWNGSIPFFTPTDSDKNIYSLNTQDSITDLGLKNSSTRLFEKNTIFITARGSVGRLALNAVPMAMNQSCYALKAKQGVSFSFLYFLTKELIHHLEVKATGSVFNSIISNDIEYTYLALPEDNDLIDKYAKKTELAFAKIELLTKENQHLIALRDWLLPLLMNGQVTVK